MAYHATVTGAELDRSALLMDHGSASEEGQRTAYGRTVLRIDGSFELVEKGGEGRFEPRVAGGVLVVARPGETLIM